MVPVDHFLPGDVFGSRSDCFFLEVISRAERDRRFLEGWALGDVSLSCRQRQDLSKEFLLGAAGGPGKGARNRGLVFVAYESLTIASFPSSFWLGLEGPPCLLSFLSYVR